MRHSLHQFAYFGFQKVVGEDQRLHRRRKPRWLGRWRPRRKPANGGLAARQGAEEADHRPLLRMRCERHVAALPTSVMNSRRRMCSPSSGDGILGVKTVASLGAKTGVESIVVWLGQCFQWLNAGVRLSAVTRPSLLQPYSISSSASIRMDCGTARPSSFAVLVLTTSSNFVGLRTGRSSGFAPRKILPAYTPTWR